MTPNWVETVQLLGSDVIRTRKTGVINPGDQKEFVDVLYPQSMRNNYINAIQVDCRVNAGGNTTSRVDWVPYSCQVLGGGIARAVDIRYGGLHVLPVPLFVNPSSHPSVQVWIELAEPVVGLLVGIDVVVYTWFSKDERLFIPKI
jgi:hypothetical protein